VMNLMALLRFLLPFLHLSAIISIVTAGLRGVMRLVAGIGDHMAGKSYSGKAGLTSPAYVRWAVAECF